MAHVSIYKDAQGACIIINMYSLYIKLYSL